MTIWYSLKHQQRITKTSKVFLNVMQELSSMLLSLNLQHHETTKIRELFNLNIMSMHEKYLGLPSMFGRNKRKFFNEIKLKITKKVKSWQNKIFSINGKKVVITTVAQVILSYTISVFKIPYNLCDEMQKVLTAWWRSKEESKSIHLVSWNKRSQPKSK